MTASRPSSIFKPRPSSTKGRRFRKPCPCAKTSDSCQTVEMLAVGQKCPHCGLDRLRLVEGGEVRCPICGYGTHRPVT
jgi:hypothetical protein